MPLSRQGARRQCPRCQPKRTTRIACRFGPLGTGANLALSLLDVSAGGVRILSAAPLDTNQTIEILLDALWLPHPIRRSARVVWCQAASNGRHIAGIKLTRPLTAADWQALAHVGCGSDEAQRMITQALETVKRDPVVVLNAHSTDAGNVEPGFQGYDIILQ